MFMSANEITARYQPLDADREEDGWSGPETNDELWERKANEAWDEGLAQGIIEHGVKKPVSLGQAVGSEGKPQIVGGHHRLAVMREESPDELMPVLHYRDLSQAAVQSFDAHRGRGGFKYT